MVLSKQLPRVGSGVPSEQLLRFGVPNVHTSTEVLSLMRRFLCVLLATFAKNSMETVSFITKDLGQFCTVVDKLDMEKSCVSTSVKLRRKSNEKYISGA